MDHCTLWPDRLFGLDWSQCCAAHDAAYTLADTRWNADVALFHCVSAATHSQWFAGLMFAGVAVFGRWFWKKGRK